MKTKHSALCLALLMALSAWTFAGCNEQQEDLSSMSEEEPANEQSSELEEPPSAEENPTASVEDMMMAIEAAYGEDYPANGEIPPEVLETEFGISTDMYINAKGAMPMISVNNDRVVVVEAVPDQADAVEAALLDARQRKIEDSMQYPMNIAKTNAAQVVRHGNFVAFLLVGVPSDIEYEPDSAEAKQYAEEQVQKAVDAFYGVFEI